MASIAVLLDINKNNEIGNVELSHLGLLTTRSGKQEANCKFMGIERWQECECCEFRVFVKHSNNRVYYDYSSNLTQCIFMDLMIWGGGDLILLYIFLVT